MRDKFYLKVSPAKGKVRFWSTWKLKSRYIGPFDIIIEVNDLAYELTLPPSLDGIHNVFCVSMLKKYIRDESHIIANYIELDI